MSEGYIVRRGGSGGGGKLYAIISVTYPAGSVCTCTDGTKTLKAKDTSGKALFNVPSSGIWAITATDGTEIASKEIEITAEGQIENVNLSYSIILLENGVLTKDYGAFANPNKYTFSNPATHNRCSVEYMFDDSVMAIVFTRTASTQGYDSGYIFFERPIDFTDLKTVEVTITAVNENTDPGIAVITKLGDAPSRVASKTLSVGTGQLDVSSVTGQNYLAILGYGRSNLGHIIKLSKWRLI